MQSANRLLRALKSGKPSFGGWQTLPGTNLSRTICRSSPHLDWIVLDTEHGNISDDMMHECVAAIAACGVSPIVRIPDNQHWMVKRALDAGAHGIIVPLLYTVEDAQNLARYTRFPPVGNRGFGSGLPYEKFVEQQPHGHGFKSLTSVDYFQQANDSLVTIVQIETKSALEQVEEIAKVDGIDVLFVGPTDLGNSIGHSLLKPAGKLWEPGFANWDPELIEAVDKVHSAAHDAGKWSGIFFPSGDQAKAYAAKGFNMINTMNDNVAVTEGFAEALKIATG